MYGPPHPCKALERSDDDSLLKCIRPLASGLLLQPGLDEIRVHGSQINTAGTRPTFPERAYGAPIDCLVITILEPRNLSASQLSDPIAPSASDRSARSALTATAGQYWERAG
jgi:hypothetical protein